MGEITHFSGINAGDVLQVAGVDLTAEVTALNGLTKAVKVIEGSLIAGTGTSGGELLALANPEGVALILLGLLIDVTTAATGVANADFGVAANATTSGDTLMDGVDIGTAAIFASNYDNPGTNGLFWHQWSASQYVTGTPSATAAGLVGTYQALYIVA